MKKDTLTAIFGDMKSHVATCQNEYELIQILGMVVKRVNLLGKEVEFSLRKKASSPDAPAIVSVVMRYNGKKVFDSLGKAKLKNMGDACIFVRTVTLIRFREDLLNLSAADKSFKSEMAKFRKDLLNFSAADKFFAAKMEKFWLECAR